MKCKYSKYLFALSLIIVVFFSYKKHYKNDKIDQQKHLHKIHLALHNKEYEQAIEECDKAIKVATSCVHTYQIYIKKAQALNKLERYKEALAIADLAIAIDSKLEEAYLLKVDPLFHLGREEELTAVLEEIIAINPHTTLKAFLNCLRLDRNKAGY